MTLPDVARLFRHWAVFPPVRVLVAGAVGFKARDDAPPSTGYTTGEELKALVEHYGGRIPGM